MGTAVKPIYTKHLWKMNRLLVLERDGYQCQIKDQLTGLKCGARATVAGHIVPRSLGGANDPSNLRAECKRHSDLEGGMLANHKIYQRTPSRSW